MHLPDRLRIQRLSPVTTTTLAATLIACAAALACGPDFTQLLWSRKSTLSAPVAYNFEQEARRLVAPKAKLPQPSKAATQDAPAEDAAKAFARVEAAGLSSSAAAKVAEMRRKDSGDEAWSWSKGKDVPEAVRLYTAAAVDFRRGSAEPEECLDDAHCSAREDEKPEHLRRAAQRFESVLALPEAQRRPRATWAAYSLGRTQRLLDAPDAAVAAFRRTREEAAKGAADPFALAVSSLGEEARVELERGHTTQAVALYAEQAAQGDDSGQLSLHEVAEKIYGDAALLKASIGDPLVRRLMVVYALSYGESDDGTSESVSRQMSADEVAAAASAAPAASAASSPAPQPAASAPAAKPQRDHRLSRLLDAILQADAGQLQDADRLAALAYAAGRYDVAAKLAPRSHSAVASWVSAKLAMRQGRKDEAAQHYAAAVRAMAAQPDTEVPQRTRYRLRAEQGMVSLARSDFTAALEQWWDVRGPYWLDLAYVAERVVTVDELKAFVDAHVPAAKPPAAEKQGNEMRQPEDPGAEWPGISPANQLRDLLARRLMREGRAKEAFAYFHGPDEQRLADPDVRQHAKDYIDALHGAETAWTRVGRARSYFEAAQIARFHGLEIMGYELGPDSQAMGGSWDLGNERPSAKDGATAAEQKRFDASAPQPNERYHYRYIAADHAVRAADALPPRSQAYAAVLCEATHWMLSSDNDAKAQALYERYVKRGAVVDWATHFGHDCPKPEFMRANWMLAKEQMHGGRVWARHHKPVAIGGAATAAAVLAGLGWWVVSGVRRRRAASAAQTPQA